MTDTTRQDVLTAIREELDAMKVPDAQEAQFESEWQSLDVDSLELIELIKALEDRYEITIADGSAKELRTVGAAADLVVELQGATPAA